MRGRTLTFLVLLLHALISIHPPRAGRDQEADGQRDQRLHFNPPSPCGEGHKKVPVQFPVTSISIHPPRAGRDDDLEILPKPNSISIHPPRAGRDGIIQQLAVHVIFQSTLPVRGGTYQRLKLYSSGIFQSTLPVRGGTQSVNARVPRCTISIHPPRAGRDIMELIKQLSVVNFNPPSPCGEGQKAALHCQG